MDEWTTKLDSGAQIDAILDTVVFNNRSINYYVLTVGQKLNKATAKFMHFS